MGIRQLMRVKNMTEYENQAKKLWGDTPAYREYEEKTKGYTQEDHKSIADGIL